jgi:mannose-6-phosphate isomerase
MTEATLAVLRERLTRWLVLSAYPLWATRGVDARGGFVERLDLKGNALADDRRARVTPRQMFAFANARELGWVGNVEDLLRRGFGEFQARYRRPDGLYRTLVAFDGTPRDERALLYDQAFVLLALATVGRVPGVLLEPERHALELRQAIETAYRTPRGDFLSGDSAHDLREANPHMHLLEACLTWAEVGSDVGWQRWADEIVELALGRFISPRTGALTEAFTSTWAPAPGALGSRVEPGHQFEWAWLLLRWASRHPGTPQHEAAQRAALDLIEVGERFGVRAGFAVNALCDDLTLSEADARLWPQTERLKAALIAAQFADDPRYLKIAASAASALASFLDTPVAGLWFDCRRASGEWVVEPAPASSFYHIVGAIHALQRMH